MSEPANEIDVMDVAAAWARVEGLETGEWHEEDFLEYFYNEIEWKSLVDVRWRGGGFAGVKTFGGLYLSYDEAQTWGPFVTLEEAEARLNLDEKTGGITKYTRSPNR